MFIRKTSSLGNSDFCLALARLRGLGFIAEGEMLLELREAAQEQDNFLLSPSQPPHLLHFWKLLLNTALNVIGYQSSPESEQETLIDKTWMF